MVDCFFGLVANNLYLVGTVHVDVDGSERLNYILNKLAPSIVALEFHKEREKPETARQSPEEVKRVVNAALDDLAINLNPVQRATVIEAQQRIRETCGFEFKSSKAYVAKNKKSRLEYIDISIFPNGTDEFDQFRYDSMSVSFKKIFQTPEFAKPILASLDGGIDAFLRFYRSNISQIYQNSEIVARFIEMFVAENLEQVKDMMPPQIARAFQQIYYPERDKAMAHRIRELYDCKNELVAVVGLAHLPGLKKNVEDLKPRVMTLAEYDSV